MAHPLADLGHRRLAHIAGPPANPLKTLRAAGFAEGARAAATCRARRWAKVDRFRSGDGGRILSWPRRPTAVFAAGDEMAIGAIHAFASAGISVPGDISVIGFDDIDLAAVGSPSLTTVRQPRSASPASPWDGLPSIP